MVNNGSTDLIVYGERPITELYVLNAQSKGLSSLVSQVQLANGESIRLGPEDCLTAIVEAPLGKAIGCADLVIITSTKFILFEVKPDLYCKIKRRLDAQLGRYYDYLASGNEASISPLVSKVRAMKEGREPYLVCITGDLSPPALESVFGCIEGVDTSLVGWASYDEIRKALGEHGFVVKGSPPHIWAEKSEYQIIRVL